ncbi:hypothetical protein B0H14DRAFT_3460539 [Mycena olivaceomarginata]|nr:hypothetical protein B0H14DRAFT_3460539 [Mycena olivaceomarginata]
MTPQIQRMAQELFPSPPPASPPPICVRDSIELLASLRHSHAAEQVLYAQLVMTPVGALNDLRRVFMITSKLVLTLMVLNNKNSSASSLIIVLGKAAVYGIDTVGVA